MIKNPKRYTITAALPYTNGPIHIGHLAGVYVPSDIYARYLRLQDKDVAFICGSDEHGVAISMKARKEGNDTLLDRTMILYGTNMGDANTHVTTNLPTLFAGGGFKHGQHLAFDRERNYPLPNLFVNVLQRLGIETDKFATSTGTMRGLEMLA